MKRICKTKVPACLLFVGLCCLLGVSSRAEDEEPNEGLLKMIVELVTDPDPDMRILGLQQVREQVPGEAVTKRIAELLPKLSVDGQVGLLDALGDRGDPAARAAALEMLESREQEVRAAALRALGPLGGAPDVPLLGRKAAIGSALEKVAARQSLVRLRGQRVNAVIVSQMAQGESNARVELLGVLAARNATETIQTVLQSAEDPDAAVRLAAIEALRILADENHIAAIVRILKAAKDDAQRRKTELALLAIFGHGRQASAEGVIAGLADADAPSRIVLLQVLARAGSTDALKSVIAELDHQDEAVRDQAVRMLSIWSDPVVAPHLLSIAKSSENLRHQVLAIRGLVRLASPQEDKPADLKILAEVLNLANRPQEKRLVLGILAAVATSQSLGLVTPLMDDPTLAEEAGLAAVMIVEKIEGREKDKLRATVEKVLGRAKTQQVRQRAEKVLKSLGG